MLLCVSAILSLFSCATVQAYVLWDVARIDGSPELVCVCRLSGTMMVCPNLFPEIVFMIKLVSLIA
uniref:Uncharacterized protein n=1 Tax=Setaria viridis TaxID=4556 RepID=A0A4U6UKR4_SETVI|nr:hypothetical protein SEVIR_5G323450v2 [Setaria viridis]